VLAMVSMEGVCLLHGRSINPRLAEWIVQKKIEAHSLQTGNGIRHFIGGMLQAARWIRAYPNAVFVIWAHHLDSNRWLQLALALARRRYIVVEQLIPASREPLSRSRLTVPIRRFVAGRALVTVVNARSQVDHYRSLLSLPAAASVVAIANSRDVNAIKRAGEWHRKDVRSLRRRLALPEAPIIICVARLAREKDQATLIEAVANIRFTGAPPVLVLVGEGPCRQSLEALARKKIPGRWILSGHQSDPVQWLAAADVFVLPSLSEGLPGALVEAMATGLPCIATDIPGNRDLVVDGETGLLISPGDVAGLASAIQRLLGDRRLAARLTSQGHKLVARDYDERKEGMAWRDLLVAHGLGDNA